MSNDNGMHKIYEKINQRNIESSKLYDKNSRDDIPSTPFEKLIKKIKIDYERQKK
tara:strand:- start:1843 stop:2007 length:165 start_codon:yes stop_codon:yes gene_type:complete